MDFDGVSAVGVVLGAVVLWILGALWYGPIFGKPWRRLVGVPADAAQQAPAPAMLATSLAISAVLAFVLASIIGDHATTSDGIVSGVFLGALLAGGALALQYLFEKRPSTLLAINTGYYAVGFAAVGAVIAAFQ